MEKILACHALLHNLAHRTYLSMCCHFSALKLRKLIVLLALTGTLFACGGSGGGGSDFTAEDVIAGAASSGDGVVNIGNGTGDDYVDGVAAATETNLAAGATTSISVNLVDANNAAVIAENTITFSSLCVGNGLASFDTAEVTTTTGFASVQYTAQGCSGEDVVTATVSTSINASVTLTIAPNVVLAVSFDSATATQLSLAGIGGEEITELTFRVVGAQSAPVIGETVSFTLSTTVGGIFLTESTVTGITSNDGLVTTILHSGTVAGPVSVVATHDASGIQGLSPDIVISTGVPEARRFSLSYGPFNPVHAFDRDGVEVSFSIIASDQFGNDVPDGTRISFVSPESGNVDSSCEAISGECSLTWRSSAPRPADGRVEIIAFTSGAEDYTDTNGNSVFDGSDVFDTNAGGDDLGEPFTDEDENGSYDLGEFYVDTNENGVRDVGNGEWDGPCLASVDASALCTGEATVTIASRATIILSNHAVRILQFGTFPAVGTLINLAQNNSFGGMIIADTNTNADALGSNPLPIGTEISFAVDLGSVIGNAAYTVPNTTSPTGPYNLSIRLPVASEDKVLTGFLILTIAVPETDIQEFIWSLFVPLATP